MIQLIKQENINCVRGRETKKKEQCQKCCTFDSKSFPEKSVVFWGFFFPFLVFTTAISLEPEIQFHSRFNTGNIWLDTPII